MARQLINGRPSARSSSSVVSSAPAGPRHSGTRLRPAPEPGPRGPARRPDSIRACAAVRDRVGVYKGGPYRLSHLDIVTKPGRCRRQAVRRAVNSWGRSTSAASSRPRGRRRPARLERSDGIRLLYPGRVHWFPGEPESGKTWVAFQAAAEALDAGRRVFWIDFEDDVTTAVDRLRALGVRRRLINWQFAYVRPDEPLQDRQGRATRASVVGGCLTSRTFALAVSTA